VCDLREHERVGSFELLPLPGGEGAIREPWRMAASYLDAIYGEEPPHLDVATRNSDRWADVVVVARSGINSPPTSSVGRLFDAVAAILGIRDAVNYEGQAAIELEQRADPDEAGSYAASIDEGAPFRMRGTDLVRGVVADLHDGADRSLVAARFHNGVVDAIVGACERARDDHGIGMVALSGGVFQNVLLVERSVARLRQAGFDVLTHSRVPPNDGGISLGQVAVAAARARRR
jgi:hydrogenase maturation protein HypF